MAVATKSGIYNGYKVIGTQTPGLRGLVLWLKFNEGSGNIAYDSSLYNNHGTIYGAVYTDGKFGKALSFDGVDDYVEVPDSPTIRDWPNGITVICWAKSNTPLWNSWGMFVSKRNSFILHPEKDKKDIKFYIYGVTSGWEYAIATADVDITQWNMWFGIYDKSEISVGWNGEIKVSKPFTEDIASDKGIIAIGWDDGHVDRFFGGTIDEVRIYNRALSENEIKMLYYNRIGAVPSKII